MRRNLLLKVDLSARRYGLPMLSSSSLAEARPFTSSESSFRPSHHDSPLLLLVSLLHPRQNPTLPITIPLSHSSFRPHSALLLLSPRHPLTLTGKTKVLSYPHSRALSVNLDKDKKSDPQMEPSEESKESKAKSGESGPWLREQDLPWAKIFSVMTLLAACIVFEVSVLLTGWRSIEIDEGIITLYKKDLECRKEFKELSEVFLQTVLWNIVKGKHFYIIKAAEKEADDEKDSKDKKPKKLLDREWRRSAPEI